MSSLRVRGSPGCPLKSLKPPSSSRCRAGFQGLLCLTEHRLHPLMFLSCAQPAVPPALLQLFASPEVFFLWLNCWRSLIHISLSREPSVFDAAALSDSEASLSFRSWPSPLFLPGAGVDPVQGHGLYFAGASYRGTQNWSCHLLSIDKWQDQPDHLLRCCRWSSEDGVEGMLSRMVTLPLLFWLLIGCCLKSLLFRRTSLLLAVLIRQSSCCRQWCSAACPWWHPCWLCSRLYSALLQLLCFSCFGCLYWETSALPGC